MGQRSYAIIPLSFQNPATRLPTKSEILKRAERTFWGGYSGYFADPDGHPWEVAHNPHWKLDRAGRVVLER